MIRRDDLIEQLNYSPLIKRYREITVTNNESSNLVDFQICIEIGGDFLEKANPNNLILVDENNLIYPYWIEEWKRPSGKAKIWTKIDLNASEIKKFKLYYQGIIGDSLLNGDEVFEFFDDFDDNLLDSSKWSITGTIELLDSNIILNNSDNLISVNDFGNGYIQETCCYATEQDINFARFVLDDDNFYELGNHTDVSNYRRMKLRTKLAGTYYDITSDKCDFRCSYKHYKLVRRSNGYVDAYQNNSLIGTQSSHLISGDMKIRINVWDNTQESSLYIDYIFVRKYTANEPTISIGSEKILYV